MQISGMLALSILCVITGIGLVIFGLHPRSRAAHRIGATGGPPLSPDLPSSSDDMTPLGLLGERPGPDEGMPRPMVDGEAEEELTGQSKTGVSPVRRPWSLWDRLKAPLRSVRGREKQQEWRSLDIPTATGTALVPKTAKIQATQAQPDDGEPGSQQ